MDSVNAPISENTGTVAFARGAAYVRMSTDQQEYSTLNQLQALNEYARANNILIVRTYSDEGISGLTLARRPGLSALLKVVQAGAADFTEILVYDMTRWGRFQDPDESAAHERSCRQAGVRVHFCAEEFINDGTPVAGMVKQLKRSMAGEYSRELSTKVRIGQTRLAKMGFWLCGMAGYGLRRVSVSSEGGRQRIIGPGERKSSATDRLILVPGPESECQTVRYIYTAFAEQHLSMIEICRHLAAAGTVWTDGTPWTLHRVKEVLSNEKYIGNMVFGRNRCVLGERTRERDSREWIRHEGAFEAIIEKPLFLAAQARFASLKHCHSNEEMINALRALLSKHHYLTKRLIDSSLDSPFTSQAYRARFGSLEQAYALVNYPLPVCLKQHFERSKVNKFAPRYFSQVLDSLVAAGVDAVPIVKSRLFRIGEELTVGFQCCRMSLGKVRKESWCVRYDVLRAPDLHLLVRMDRGATRVLDYFLLPRAAIASPRMRLHRTNPGVVLDAFRYDDLQPLIELGRRVDLHEV
ncbi:recombinase family protein [Chitinimonas naiadis]